MMLIERMISHLKDKAGQLAYTSRLYNWTLGHGTPELIQTFIDPWPGRPARGRWLCQGAFAFDHESLPLEGNFWQSDKVSRACLDHLQSFVWLRDLRSYGGEKARNQAREMMLHWIDHHPNWTPQSWRPDILGQRIAIWLSLFDFTCAHAPEQTRKKILASLQRQARHLSRSLATHADPPGIGGLQAAKGLVYAGLAFESRENWLEQGLEIFERQIPIQILSDGGHISRMPENSYHALRLCFEINSALARAKYPRLEVLQHAMDRLTPAVRFFRHGDKSFACFHQGLEQSPEDIDAVLAQTDGKIRIPKSLGHCGYERCAAGRSALIMDCGSPPPRPYDVVSHASPLAFEFGHGRERILVNCGTHLSDPHWAAMLRCSAAHNTLTIDDRNSVEIRADGHIGKRRGDTQVERMEAEGGVILDARQDGYENSHGVIHRRRIFLGGDGCDLRGEDTLEETAQLPDKEMIVALRFHLHPRVLVSLIQQGRECLLRTPAGHGWRFYHIGGELRLENSVYLGDGGQIRKTKQIVLYLKSARGPFMIQWALQKENQHRKS